MSLKRLLSGLVMIGLGLVLIASTTSVNAADYLRPANRTLELASTEPSVVTDYTVSWQYPAPATVGSIRFVFCDTGYLDDPCANPGGSFAAATLSAQTGETGFSVLSQSANEILISRTPVLTSIPNVSYTFSSVTNPGIQTRFFVRMFIYQSSDGTGAYNHAGSVLSSINEPITITTEVPPELVFCVGITITGDCVSFAGNWIDYGDLSTTSTDFATSQFGVVTNASGGYVVTANGAPMTSGSNVITPLNPPNPSLIGISQFGLNLRANTIPAVGQDPAGAGTSTVGTGYDTPNFFKYVSGDPIAFAPAPTYFNTFTVTYIVNVSPSQPGGIYNTTIAFVCTASF